MGRGWDRGSTVGKLARNCPCAVGSKCSCCWSMGLPKHATLATGCKQLTAHLAPLLLPLRCNLLPATTSSASIFSCCAQITHSKIEPDPMREMRNASSRLPLSSATLLTSAPSLALSLSRTASQWPMKATSDPAETVVIAEQSFGVVEPPRPPRDEVNTLASCLMLNGTKIFLIKHFLTLISANGGKTLRKLPLFCITLCYKVCKWEGTLTVLFLIMIKIQSAVYILYSKLHCAV